jgi:hypothetical protein
MKSKRLPYLLLGAFLPCFSILASAQTFKQNDTLSLKPKFNFKVGISLGVNNIIPQTSGFTYNHKNGYEQHVFLGVDINLTRKFTLTTGYSYGNQTARLSHQNNRLFEDFDLKTIRQRVPLLLIYDLSNINPFNIGVGIAYNNLSFETENEYSYVYGLAQRNIKGTDDLKSTHMHKPSVIIKAGKTTLLSKKSSLEVTLEAEWLASPINVYNKITLNNGSSIEYKTIYHVFNYRLGLYYKY